MARPGETFTLLESGTTRLHFKLAKALEEASSSRQQDRIILETVKQLRNELTSRSASTDISQLASALLTLLHCLHQYRSSSQSRPNTSSHLDVSFALIPTLQLLSLATDWKHITLAHQLLPHLMRPEKLGSRLDLSSPASEGADGRLETTSADDEREHKLASLERHRSDDSSSLLLLNTFRAQLMATVEQPHDASIRHRSRSPTASRSSSRSKPGNTPQDATSARVGFRAIACLRSLALGIPQGPAVLPSLASLLVTLTRHPDPSIRSMTLNAMLTCASVDTVDQAQKEGQIEMLEAALTIIRLVLASTYAFSPGSDLDEQQGMILSEMEKRVDPNPAVLRSCIRVVEHARSAGIISTSEAACHAFEVLQASRWAPMHLDLPTLQQERIASAVATRTESMRARKAAQQSASLQSDHDYHGSYAPWLVNASLESLTRSIESMGHTSPLGMSQETREEILRTALSIYSLASQGKNAALAVCISAARCIGALHQPGMSNSTSGHPESETFTFWSSLSTHIKAQLRSTNPNRKTAGLVLLEALLPVGWAQANAGVGVEDAQQEDSSRVAETSPLRMSEEDMGHLMSLLADQDSSLRKRALKLLHQVDPNLTTLLRTQLQAAVDSEVTSDLISSRNNFRSRSSDPVTAIVQRLAEVALFAASSACETRNLKGEQVEEARSALAKAVESGATLGLFGPFDHASSEQVKAWAVAFHIALSSLPLEVQVDMPDLTMLDTKSDSGSISSGKSIFRPK